MATLQTITPLEVEHRRRQGETIDLIDVRTPAEFRSLHAAAARSLPLDELSGPVLQELAERASKETVYLICQQGGRGRTACQKLRDAGGAQVVNVEGGTLAWAAAGLPVVRGKPSMSLERQVRIGAGALVLAGLALAHWVHPGFVGLSAFVGAGLIFSGVTDICGMAFVLAKMPWNRAAGTPTTCNAAHS